jgi:hypothetical protein
MIFKYLNLLKNNCTYNTNGHSLVLGDDVVPQLGSELQYLLQRLQLVPEGAVQHTVQGERSVCVLQQERQVCANLSVISFQYFTVKSGF